MTDLDRLLKFLAEQPPTTGMSLTERRAVYDRAEAAFPLPDNTTAKPITVNGVAAELIDTGNAVPGRHVLYLHGGGYGIGSIRSHRHLAAAIARDARATVLLPDYRLAPEHPFPAAIDDAIAAYHWLLGRTTPSSIVVMGDSAGGGLAVATALAARRDRLALPAAIVCLSPWADLTCAPDSDVARAAASDPIVKQESIAGFATAYLAATPPTEPLASPLFGDLAGLPPMLIQASNAECLRFDAIRLAEAARKAGVDATLELSEGTPHVWHWFWPRLDLGRQSIATIGRFVESRLGSAGVGRAAD